MLAGTPTVDNALAAAEEDVHPILRKLQGGDRRSTGAADEVAAEIAADEALFATVFAGMVGDDPVVRMRAADAIEKATRESPALLQPYKERLLGEVAAVAQQEVRWHLAQMIARLTLDPAEQERAVTLLARFLQDESRIVQVNAMQALADLAAEDDALRAEVAPMLRRLTESGSPAVRARGRKLLARLGDEG